MSVTEVDLSSPNLSFSSGDRGAYFADWTMPLSSSDRRGMAIFNARGGAIVTARDDFVIGFSADEVVGRIADFGVHRGNARDASAALGVRWGGDWVSRADDAKSWIRENRNNLRDYVYPICYRPFDIRYVFYHELFLDTPAKRIMAPMLGGDNFALAFGRSSAAETADHFLVSANLVEAKCAERSRQCHAAPLWLRESIMGDQRRIANFSADLRALIERRTGLRVVDDAEGDWRGTIGALDVLGYIYAVVNSNYYRERIADLVAEDYPRIPFTSDRDRLRCLSAFGSELIGYHTNPTGQVAISTYPVVGDNVPTRERWVGEGDFGSIWINRTQYFAEVPTAVWEYRIGGWGVVQEWLKRRRNEILSADKIVYLQRVMGSLSESARAIARIDEYVDDDLIERGS